MTLSIRDPHADHMARELANITGETITEAVGKALEERLAKVRRQDNVEERLQRIDELISIFRENHTGEILTDDDMYDEYGLPREDK